jgi:hypothetical protein
MTTNERMALLLRAQRAAEEAAEALRLMVEHELEGHMPALPDFLALRTIADSRLDVAGEMLSRAVAKPKNIREVDSESFARLGHEVALRVAGRPRFRS